MPLSFSVDETVDPGSDLGTPVSREYRAHGDGFTGKVRWVQIDVDKAAQNADHLISPEERFRVAMVRQ
jgi:hypothetical protein